MLWISVEGVFRLWVCMCVCLNWWSASSPTTAFVVALPPQYGRRFIRCSFVSLRSFSYYRSLASFHSSATLYLTSPTNTKWSDFGECMCVCVFVYTWMVSVFVSASVSIISIKIRFKRLDVGFSLGFEAGLPLHAKGSTVCGLRVFVVCCVCRCK